MKKPKSHEKVFAKILKNPSYDLLKPYKAPETWTDMSEKDKQLLAQLFFLCGKKEIPSNLLKAEECFSLSSQLSPGDANLLFRQALAYAEQKEQNENLNLAQKAFKETINLHPKHAEAWCEWGTVLIHLGVLTSEVLYLQEANQKFVKAKEYSEGYPVQFLTHLNWKWGFCQYLIGKHSGEPAEFYKAIAHYQQAEQLGLANVFFYEDRALAMIELGNLLARKEFFLEAIFLSKKILEEKPDHFQIALQLACTCQNLFNLDPSQEHFESAYEAFHFAAGLSARSSLLWYRWGQLTGDWGKKAFDSERLKESIEFLEKALKLEPEHPQILASLGHNLVTYGFYEDKIEILREGEKKIQKALSLAPDNAQIWYFYGICMNTFGRYFDSQEFYQKAIEKFEKALNLNPYSPVFWYGLAFSHFAIGDLNEDVENLDRSDQCCTKVYQNGEESAQFWNDWGITLLRKGEISQEQHIIETAIDKFENAIKFDGYGIENENCNLEFFYNYACALDFLGEITEDPNCLEKAITILSQIVARDPFYIEPRYHLAITLSHLGELASDLDSFEKALDHFRILLHENPEDEAAWHECGITCIHLARLIDDPSMENFSIKIYEQAESKIMQAISLGNQQAFYTLACLYALMGKIQLSIHFLERSEQSGVLPPVEELLYDEWLETIKDTPEFRNFLAYLALKQEKFGD